MKVPHVCIEDATMWGKASVDANCASHWDMALKAPVMDRRRLGNISELTIHGRPGRAQLSSREFQIIAGRNTHRFLQSSS